MEHKLLALALTKASAKGRTLTGYASTFGTRDLVGDIVMAGAFSASLLARPSVPILWSHDPGEPIGRSVEMHEDSKGLFLTAKLSDTRRAADTLALVNDGAVSGLSIGYNVTDHEYIRTADGKGARLLKSVDLLEVSVCTWPANPEAQVLGVKSAGAVPRDPLMDYIEGELLEVQVIEAEEDFRDALLLRRAELEVRGLSLMASGAWRPRKRA